MISPREKYEKEAFWELADEIASTDIQTTSMYGQDNRALGRAFRSFFTKKPKSEEEQDE